MLFFLVVVVHKILLLKVIKTPPRLSSLGPAQEGPNDFSLDALVYAVRTVLLQFCFQLAGHKFSGLLPKSDLVLYVLKG